MDIKATLRRRHRSCEEKSLSQVHMADSVQYPSTAVTNSRDFEYFARMDVFVWNRSPMRVIYICKVSCSEPPFRINTILQEDTIAKKELNCTQFNIRKHSLKLSLKRGHFRMFLLFPTIQYLLLFYEYEILF